MKPLDRAVRPINHWKVFISHSHQDRHEAVQLSALLDGNGADAFLDQDHIQAGDVLPQRLRNGINRCDTFLLIWSWRAAASVWVAHEWKIARSLSKRIVPYLLDKTPLPTELRDLVHVEAEDRMHGDAELLRAVFGSAFLPDRSTLFPGHWVARLDVGTAVATYNLELRANGQVEGDAGIDPNSDFLKLINPLPEIGESIKQLYTMRAKCSGTWTYDQNTRTLTLELESTLFGNFESRTVTIVATGSERGAIQGRDLTGLSWEIQRL